VWQKVDEVDFHRGEVHHHVARLRGEVAPPVAGLGHPDLLAVAAMSTQDHQLLTVLRHSIARRRQTAMDGT
jgi:hypothetical protein